jgi:hypothetical protein
MPRLDARVTLAALALAVASGAGVVADLAARPRPAPECRTPCRCGCDRDGACGCPAVVRDPRPIAPPVEVAPAQAPGRECVAQVERHDATLIERVEDLGADEVRPALILAREEEFDLYCPPPGRETDGEGVQVVHHRSHIRSTRGRGEP